MTDRLTDRVAIITGSDSGIGQATAVAFAQEGADVVVTYHDDEDGAKKTVEGVEAAGRRAVLRKLDVTSEAAIEALFDEAIAEFGRAPESRVGCPAYITIYASMAYAAVGCQGL